MASKEFLDYLEQFNKGGYSSTISSKPKQQEQLPQETRANVSNNNDPYLLTPEAQNFVRPIGAFGSAAANAATMGSLNVYQKQNTPELYEMGKQLQQEYPKTALAGELAGSLMPFNRAGNIVKGISSLANPALSATKRIGQAAAKGALEVAPISAAQGGFKAVEEGKPLSEVFQNTAIGGLEGAALGGGLGGALKGIGEFRKVLKTPALPKMLDEPVKYKPTDGIRIVEQQLPVIKPLPIPNTSENIRRPFKLRSLINPIKETQPSMNTTEPLPFAPQSNLRPLKPNEGINSPLPQNDPLKPQNTAAKYSPETQTKLDALESKYKQDIANEKKFNTMDPQTQSKKLMGWAMKHSAAKREIIQGESLISVEGGLTEKELANKINKLKTNYSGKEVITPDGEGIATGKMSFGKVGVKYPDGTIKYHLKEQITPKIDIDAQISAQKQALNAPKVESDINSPLIENEPVKTQNTQTSNATWKNKDFDQPVNITGEAGTLNGKKYYNVEGSNSAIPEDELIFNNKQTNINPMEQPSITPPNIESGNIKQRKFISNSYLNSKIANKQMKTEMAKNIPTYNEITNKATLDEANKIIGNDIEKHAREFLANDKLDTALETAKGISLIQKSIASGNVKLANEISINMAEKATTAGQSIQALSIMKRMTPEGMLQYGNKQLQQWNKLNPSKTPLNFTEEEAKFITNNMNQIQQFNNGELKLVNMNLQNFAENKLAEIIELIGRKIPANMGQKLRGIQRINLLLNPKTMVRNVTGNILTGGIGNLSDTLRAGIDKGISKITGNRTALLPNLGEQLSGAKQGFKRVLSDFKNDVNTSPAGTQYDLGTGIARVSPFKSQPLKTLDKLTTTGLRLGDDPFYQGFYNDTLKNQMKLANVTTPTNDMIKHADQVARERTFQDTNKITELFTGLQRLLNFGKDFGIGSIVIPFAKTPANILARALEYSPIEIVKGIGKAVIDAGKGQSFNQYKFVDSLAKGLTGTALIGAGYQLAQKGTITGNAPKDIDTRKYMEANGILPYSFKVGDTSYTYDWAQPSSIPLAIGADIYYNLKNKKDATNTLIAAGSSGLQTLLSQPLIQGLTKVFGGAQYGGTMSDNLINSMLGAGTQAVPLGGIMRQVAELKDPYKRNTYEKENAVNSYLVNPVKNSIPGIRESLPVKVNSFGEKAIAAGAFNTFLNPARSGIETKINPAVNAELLRLSEQGGENKQFPTLAKPNISYKLTKKGETQKLTLTGDQLSQYQEEVGKLNTEQISKIITTPKYINSNDKQKAEIIAGVMSKTKQVLENKLLKGQGIKEYISGKKPTLGKSLKINSRR